MKTIIDSLEFDFIIETSLRAKKDSNNEFVKNKNGMFEHYKDIDRVYFYYPVYSVDNGALLHNIKVEINSTSLFVLFTQINEMINVPVFLEQVEQKLPF
jgi:hypothetical protein